MKRIGIYFYYDKKGIFDKYAINFVKELKTVVDRLIIVANGYLDDVSIKIVGDITNELIIRKNIGLDVLAYKEAFEYVGWKKLSDYDEIVYCNSTVFGPAHPFKEMFDHMSTNEELDFWGITSHPKYIREKKDDDMICDDLEYDNLCRINPYGYLPKHIQHYFVVYRKKFVITKDLQYFWNNLSNINTYVETVAKFETVFTKYFEDKGYKWDTYIHFDSEEEGTNYLLLNKPDIAIIKYKSPVIKRKVFYIDKKHSNDNITNSASNLLQYLYSHNLYDVDLIIENIKRTNNTSEYKEILERFNNILKNQS